MIRQPKKQVCVNCGLVFSSVYTQNYCKECYASLKQHSNNKVSTIVSKYQ
jgi:predicted amidophosphoribosyltransferase